MRICGAIARQHAVSCTVLVEFLLVVGILLSASLSSASVSPSSRSIKTIESINASAKGRKPRGTAENGGETSGNDEECGYYDHVPWLGSVSSTNGQGIDEAARYEELPPSVFSPTGRLHPVEAAVRAGKVATPLSNLLVAIKCRDGLLVVSTYPVSPNVDARIASLAGSNQTNTISSASIQQGNDDNSGHSDDGIESNQTTTNETLDVSGSNNSNPHTGEESHTYPSLFLFEETCASTSTGPIFDIHPCMVGATAGNAVDNRILGEKLLDLGLATTNFEEDDPLAGAADRVAKDLANQLQVVTQDITATQKQRLGRMLASSAVVLGNKKLWRIDPTGQFWDCQATVLGHDADRAEEAFCCRLFEQCERRHGDDKNGIHDPRELLESMTHDEAFEFAKEFLRHQTATQRQPKSNTALRSSDTKASIDASATKEGGIELPVTELSSQTYWQAVILDYASLTTRGTPRRILRRGSFGIQNKE